MIYYKVKLIEPRSLNVLFAWRVVSVHRVHVLVDLFKGDGLPAISFDGALCAVDQGLGIEIHSL